MDQSREEGAFEGARVLEDDSLEGTVDGVAQQQRRDDLRHQKFLPGWTLLKRHLTGFKGRDFGIWRKRSQLTSLEVSSGSERKMSSEGIS